MIFKTVNSPVQFEFFIPVFGESSWGHAAPLLPVRMCSLLSSPPSPTALFHPMFPIFLHVLPFLSFKAPLSCGSLFLWPGRPVASCLVAAVVQAAGAGGVHPAVLTQARLHLECCSQCWSPRYRPFIWGVKKPICEAVQQ